MPIHFTAQRWQTIKDTYRAWWAGKLSRPLFNISVRDADPGQAEPALPARHFTSFYDLSVPAEAIAERWEYDLSCQRFLGDGFPSIWPNFGPGVAAAFLGAELRNDFDSVTTWYYPRETREVSDWRWTFDPENVWLRRVEDITRAARARFNGMVQVGMTDIGGNLDMLSSFRPSEALLYDLIDDPESVKARTWELHDLWWRYFRHFEQILYPTNPGYTAWASIFSEVPYYMLQCDFCYMIGPDMFDEFVKPELVATCRKLAHPFYHLDGIGQLPHLDSLLAIPELKGIQWIPGTGAPETHLWPEVYRKIRDAGKLIQLFANQSSYGLDIIDVLADQLGSAEGIIVIADIQPHEVNHAAEILAKYGAS